MDKPISMSVKDYLLRVMSVRTNTPLKTLEAVIKHQYDGVIEAMQKEGIHSIEVSGFGKFLFNKKKAASKYKKFSEDDVKYRKELEDPNISESRKKSIEQKIGYFTKWSSNLKPDVKSNSGGMEEQASTSQRISGGSLSGEVADL